MRPRLLALDLDGTVLTDDCQLPMGHVHAVRAIRRLGVEVVVATGRGLLTTRWVLKALGIEGPVVCFNGSWVGHPDRTPFATRHLVQDDVHAVIAALAEHDGVLCCYPDAETWVMSHETEQTRTWRHLYKVPIQIRADLRANWRGDSIKMMYVDTPARILATRDYLQEIFRSRFSVVISQPDRLEILPTAVTKGWGLIQLAGRLGIPREAVWAAGDADNDREMLRWAGHGCAMGQAADSLRAIARHVLPSVEARGLCALVPLIERAIAAS
jgi:Cof subfamily protein (haloacid dehalogenase superfamily)